MVEISLCSQEEIYAFGMKLMRSQAQDQHDRAQYLLGAYQYVRFLKVSPL